MRWGEQGEYLGLQCGGKGLWCDRIVGRVNSIRGFGVIGVGDEGIAHLGRAGLRNGIGILSRIATHA